MKMFRQGDILLKEIEKLPENKKILKDKVLAYGEVTEHSHRFERSENIDRFEYERKLYLQVYQPTPLIHEEHNPIIILPGIYEQIQEREYDYIDNELKKVID